MFLDRKLRKLASDFETSLLHLLFIYDFCKISELKSLFKEGLTWPSKLQVSIDIVLISKVTEKFTEFT